MGKSDPYICILGNKTMCDPVYPNISNISVFCILVGVSSQQCSVADPE